MEFDITEVDFVIFLDTFSARLVDRIGNKFSN